MTDAAPSDDGAWRFKRYPKQPGTEAFDGRMPAQCLPEPPGDLENYASLAEVQEMISTKPGGRANVYRTRSFLQEHKIPVQKIGGKGVRALVRKDLVLAALGRDAEAKRPTAEFVANEWVCMRQAVEMVWGRDTPKRRQFTRKLLAQYGVAVFRPRGNLTLAPRVAVEHLVRELKAVKRLPVPREKRPAHPNQLRALEIGQHMPKAGRVLKKRSAAAVKEEAVRFVLAQHTAQTVRPTPAAEPAPINFTREPEIRHRDIRDLPFTRRKSAL